MSAPTIVQATRSTPRRAALGALLAVGLLVLSACDVPVAPAGKLYNAWKANDPSAATGDFTTHAAKVEMFSQAYTDSAGWFFLKCEGAAGSTYCTWVNKLEGRLVLRVDNASQQVTSVERISLGSIEAGRVFHAWRIGNKSQALSYGSSAAVDKLFGLTYKASDHWTPDGCEGAAGSLYCTWNSDASSSITLRVDTMSSPKKVVETTGTIFGP